jgi:outer membrane murein-binding lipoprotein Lpp
MTKKDALRTAIAQLSTDNSFDDVVDTLNKIVAQLDKPRTELTPEQKTARNEARKAHTASVRASMVATVIPVLRAVMTADMTAKEIFEAAKYGLPADFTANKVQNVLLREMASEVVKTETKGKANTYRLA